MRWRGGIALALVATAMGAVAPSTPAGAVANNPWVVGASANPGLGPELHGTSCVTASFCVAVGTTAAGFAVSDTLVEQWDGTVWSRIDTPNASVANVLEAVSCTSVSWCVAVGSSTDGHTEQPLVELWDGSSWSIMPSLTVPHGGTLTAVSCIAPTYCMAVGSESASGAYSPAIALRWNGTAWPRLVLPPRGIAADSLEGVSCVSTSRCIAVGSSAGPPKRRALIERWNGLSWSIVDVALGDPFDDNLAAVSCFTATSCVAVGTGHAALAVVLSNGLWRIAPSPAVGALSVLRGISCVSSTSCTAVGLFQPPGDINAHPLVESWNGTAWTQTTAPNGGLVNELDAVGCVAASGCVAAGAIRDAKGARTTLVESNLANMHTLAVTVTLTSSELDSLYSIAQQFGQTPQAFLNNAVAAMAYLITTLPSTPLPVTLPPAGLAASYVVVFDPNTLVGFQAVETKFVASPPDAIRASLYITEFLIFIGGG